MVAGIENQIYKKTVDSIIIPIPIRVDTKSEIVTVRVFFFKAMIWLLPMPT